MGLLNNLMDSLYIAGHSDTAIHKTHGRYHLVHGAPLSEGGVDLFIYFTESQPKLAVTKLQSLDIHLNNILDHSFPGSI